jgi:large subunit ribosomal protein L21
MYAVVSSGGKQYRVEPGSLLTLERVAAEAGATLTFDRVLLIGDGDEVTVGTPVVTGASVTATVLGEQLGPKLVIFKFKQKVKYRRRTGHRQHLMRVRIDTITADGRAVSAAKEPAKEPAKAKPEAEAHGAKTTAAARPRRTAAPGATAGATAKPARPRATRAKRAGTEPADASAAESTADKPKPKRTRRASTPKVEE